MKLNKSDFANSTRDSIPPNQTREPNLNFNTMNMVSPISPMTVRHADADINIKVGKIPLSPGGRTQRSFFDRTFGKLEKGSLRGSIFSLCSAAIGGGVLSLPYMFALSGWATGIILIFVGTIAGIWSNLLLAEMGDKHKLSNLDQVAFASGGTKMKSLLTVCVLLYIFFACIGYQIIFCQLIQYIYQSLCKPENRDFANTLTFRLLVNSTVALLIFLPLSAQRDLSTLSKAGIVSIIAIAYTSLVLIVELKYYYDEFRPIATVYAFYFDLNFFSSCAMTFFAFTCQIQLLPIYSELINPNYRRIKKVVTRSLAIDFVAYTLVATAGYFSTFNFTNTIVVERPALPKLDPDYFMLVAAGAISCVMFAALPVNAVPARNLFFTFVMKQPNYS